MHKYVLTVMVISATMSGCSKAPPQPVAVPVSPQVKEACYRLADISLEAAEIRHKGFDVAYAHQTINKHPLNDAPFVKAVDFAYATPFDNPYTMRAAFKDYCENNMFRE